MQSVKEQLIRWANRARTEARSSQEHAKQMRIDADRADANAALLIEQADEYDAIRVSKYGDDKEPKSQAKFTDYMPR